MSIFFRIGEDQQTTITLRVVLSEGQEDVFSVMTEKQEKAVRKLATSFKDSNGDAKYGYILDVIESGRRKLQGVKSRNEIHGALLYVLTDGKQGKKPNRAKTGYADNKGGATEEAPKATTRRRRRNTGRRQQQVAAPATNGGGVSNEEVKDLMQKLLAAIS